MNERSALITLDGEEFELLFSTKAAKEIDKRYGGLENLGKALEFLLTRLLRGVTATYCVLVQSHHKRDGHRLFIILY